MGFRLIETIGPEEESPDAEHRLVPMRDAVRLATDVSLPEGPGPFPAVLVRTPYDKASTYTGLKFQAKYFARRGYALVTQDVRGKYRSEGETVPYAHDLDDGYDTVDWIVGQTWSDGRVAAMGASYYGYTAWAVVACGHPAVRAAVPQVTGVELPAMHMSSDWEHVLPNLLAVNDLAQIWTDHDCYLTEIDYAVRPVIEAADEAIAALGPNRALRDLFERARRSQSYSSYGDRHPYSVTEVPVLHMVSWFDPGLAPYGMRDFRTFDGQAERRSLHFLRASASDHGNFALADVGRGDARDPYADAETREEVLASETDVVADFLDAVLDPDGTRRPLPPRVRYQVGHGEWRHAATWPPPEGEDRSWLLVPSDGAVGSGDLVDAVAGVDGVPPGTVHWVHDPLDPVPSDTGIEEIWLYLSSYPDIRGRRARSDVLTFTTGPLTSPLDIAGRPRIDATLSSTGPSMHVFALLADVEPDGTTRPLSHAALNLPGDGFGAPTALLLDDIAYRFRAGHRIQVQISSSDFPWYVVHPGTAENPWLATDVDRNEQSLQVGGERAPRLTLPVLPAPSDALD